MTRSRQAVLAALASADRLTQVEIARAAGLSPATVSAQVTALLADGLVEVREVVRSGRRARAVSLATPDGVLVGVHCYLDQIRVMADPGGGRDPVVRSERLPLGHRAEHAMAAARDLTDQLVADLGRDATEVLAVGVGVPAPVEARSRRVGGAGLRDGWGPVVADPSGFAPASGTLVVVDNEGNLGALAEARLGAGRGRRTVVQVGCGRGVCGGIVVDGALEHGRTGTAAELGHLTIDPQGPVCSCGNRGCLQVYAGTGAVLALLSDSRGPLTIDEVLELADRGDPGCRRALSDVGRHLGTALASVCMVLDPDILVVGGPVAAAGDLLLDPLRQVLAERTAVTAGAVVDVVAAELGADAAVHGALLVAQDAVRAVLGRPSSPDGHAGGPGRPCTSRP